MKIIINLDEILKNKGISAYKLAKSIDVTYHTILTIKNNKGKGIQWDTLEKICTFLECSPGDIIKIK